MLFLHNTGKLFELHYHDHNCYHHHHHHHHQFLVGWLCWRGSTWACMPRIKKTASSSFVKGEEVFDDDNGEDTADDYHWLLINYWHIQLTYLRQVNILNPGSFSDFKSLFGRQEWRWRKVCSMSSVLSNAINIQEDTWMKDTL